MKIVSYLQALVPVYTLLANFNFTYAYALIFIHRRFGSFLAAGGPYWVLILQKKWVLISKLGGLY